MPEVGVGVLWEGVVECEPVSLSLSRSLFSDLRTNPTLLPSLPPPLLWVWVWAWAVAWGPSFMLCEVGRSFSALR